MSLSRELRPISLMQDEFAPFGDILTGNLKAPGVDNSDLAYYARVFETAAPEEISLGLMKCKVRPLQLFQMERHRFTPELLVNMGDHCVIAVATASSDTTPNEAEVRAFEFPSGTALLLGKGTWHWAPYPTQCASWFLVGFKAGTEDDDLLLAELSQPLQIAMP